MEINQLLFKLTHLKNRLLICSQSLWYTSEAEFNLQQSVCNLQLYWNNSLKDIFQEYNHLIQKRYLTEYSTVNASVSFFNMKIFKSGIMYHKSNMTQIPFSLTITWNENKTNSDKNPKKYNYVIPVQVQKSAVNVLKSVLYCSIPFLAVLLFGNSLLSKETNFSQVWESLPIF